MADTINRGNMNIQSSLRNVVSFAVLTFSMTVGSPLMRAQSPDSQQISKLLVEAKREAVLLADDADTLHSYTASNIHWQTHTRRLAQMADHVNELGKVNKQLSDLKAEGSPWQQQAIVQIDPLLRDLATNLTATIGHLKENQSRIHFQPYREYVVATHESASGMSRLICDFVDYDKAQAKAKDLEQKLELTVADNETPTTIPVEPPY
jgi:hypothetical protein